jgi:hypothetical protein
MGLDLKLDSIHDNELDINGASPDLDLSDN